MERWEPQCRACNDSGWANWANGDVCTACQPDEPKYVLIDNATIPVTADEVARFCEAAKSSLRAAAPYYGVSPATLSRFMRRNGYKSAQRFITEPRHD